MESSSSFQLNPKKQKQQDLNREFRQSYIDDLESLNSKGGGDQLLYLYSPEGSLSPRSTNNWDKKGRNKNPVKRNTNPFKNMYPSQNIKYKYFITPTISPDFKYKYNSQVIKTFQTNHPQEYTVATSSNSIVLTKGVELLKGNPYMDYEPSSYFQINQWKQMAIDDCDIDTTAADLMNSISDNLLFKSFPCSSIYGVSQATHNIINSNNLIYEKKFARLKTYIQPNLSIKSTRNKVYQDAENYYLENDLRGMQLAENCDHLINDLRKNDQLILVDEFLSRDKQLKRKSFYDFKFSSIRRYDQFVKTQTEVCMDSAYTLPMFEGKGYHLYPKPQPCIRVESEPLSKKLDYNDCCHEDPYKYQYQESPLSKNKYIHYSYLDYMIPELEFNTSMDNLLLEFIKNQKLQDMQLQLLYDYSFQLKECLKNPFYHFYVAT